MVMSSGQQIRSSSSTPAQALRIPVPDAGEMHIARSVGTDFEQDFNQAARIPFLQADSAGKRPGLVQRVRGWLGSSSTQAGGDARGPGPATTRGDTSGVVPAPDQPDQPDQPGWQQALSVPSFDADLPPGDQGTKSAARVAEESNGTGRTGANYIVYSQELFPASSATGVEGSHNASPPRAPPPAPPEQSSSPHNASGFRRRVRWGEGLHSASQTGVSRPGFRADGSGYVVQTKSVGSSGERVGRDAGAGKGPRRQGDPYTYRKCDSKLTRLLSRRDMLIENALEKGAPDADFHFRYYEEFQVGVG